MIILDDDEWESAEDFSIELFEVECEGATLQELAATHRSQHSTIDDIVFVWKFVFVLSCENLPSIVVHCCLQWTAMAMAIGDNRR